jgi:hypothetical protein
MGGELDFDNAIGPSQIEGAVLDLWLGVSQLTFS